ncbi:MULTISPECIES: ComEC/Rec2 family competence protein [unclassified Mycoplasma]|uniref:ComEC/Rec2 family competence protein n=1 Tax=unclassified Mycoplasma TaxID=2683645 RepID=UPI00211BA615|nr:MULTISPECIES: ComEC/Rec2 family competence protein [unclassified Mycoplasma]UUM20115.1 ComEC/Rec2 family competence protein [Mycoplasma sp. 1578d]UUM25095.1 ComEC/Rec2 family competence protein [Mycoplasma sp. 3686d]
MLSLLAVSVFILWKLNINSITLGQQTKVFTLKKISPKTVIFQDAFFRDYLAFKKEKWMPLSLNAQYTISANVEELNSKYISFNQKGVFYQLNIRSIRFYQNTYKSWFFNLDLFNYDQFNKLVKSLLFGYSNDQVLEQYNFLGIVHLIVLSGMHFNLIINFLKIFFGKFKFLQWLPFVLMVAYFAFCNWTISSIKAILLITCLEIYMLKNPKPSKKLKLKILLGVGAVCLSLNPWYSYSLGFWFSFLLSAFIYLNINKPVNYKDTINDYFSIWLFSVALVFIFTQKFYPLSFFVSLLLTPVIELFVFLLFFGFWLEPFVSMIYLIFDFLNNFFIFMSFYIVFQITNTYLYWSIKVLNLLWIYWLSIRKSRHSNNYIYN